MKNSLIPESELKILGEVFEKVDQLVKNHDKCFSLTPEMVTKASDTEQIHMLMYTDLVKDAIASIFALRDIFAMSEGEFIALITDNGKKSITEVKEILMKNMIVDLLGLR